MKLEVSLAARLEFLARVTEKECQHLLDTDKRLFGNLFTLEEARTIAADPINEHIEDIAVFASALRSGHNFVPELVAAARRCVAKAGRLRNL